MLLAQLAVAPVFLQMSSTFSLHVTSCGFSPAVYGALISFNGVLIVLLELPLITFTQRACPRKIIAIGYALVGLAFALNGVAQTIPALILVVVVLTFGEMISMPVGAAYITEGVLPEMRGRYMGAYGFIWALGLTLGPGIGLRVHAHAPALLWSVCGLLGLVAAALVLRSAEGAASAGEAPRPALRG